jgi:PAS domain S-box-containing protein
MEGAGNFDGAPWMNDSALFCQLMDCLPDAVYFKDAKGRFIRINRVLAGWYGLKDPARAVGKTEADFVPPGFAKATLENERRMIETGVPILDQEERVVGKDGKSHWVLTTKLPLRNGKGRIAGTMGISRDIRNVKRAEEKARDSEALYRSLIETLPQCIFRKDVDGKYVYVNQRVCDLHGLAPQDILGKSDLDINPPGLAAKYRRDDQWVMSHQKLFEGVEEVQMAKKKRFKIRIYKTPVYDANGRVIGVQGVFTPESDAP